MQSNSVTQIAFEALTLGLPCVVSNVGGLPSIVNENCGILSNDLKKMKIFLEDQLKNSAKYDCYSKNAILRSKEIDNIKDYIIKIEFIYEE